MLKFVLYIDRNLTDSDVTGLVHMVDTSTSKAGLPRQSHCIHISSQGQADGAAAFNCVSHAGLNVSLLHADTPYALSTFNPNKHMRKKHKQILII